MINATPFNAGIGVSGAGSGAAVCNYRPATPEELHRCTGVKLSHGASVTPSQTVRVPLKCHSGVNCQY